MKFEEPFVSIVICTRNRADSLDKLALRSMASLDYSAYEVIVIDDASNDNTAQILEKYKSKIKNFKVIKNDSNKGLCYVRNLGVEYSQGDIIAFTDDDCAVDKNWLKELVKPYLKDEKIVAVGGKSYIKNTTEPFNSSNSILGCNMSFRKKIFNKFLFDTNIYFNKSSYYDETEFINRLKELSYKVAYSQGAVVRHFIEYAEYRSNVIIGRELNQAYIEAKRLSLATYYRILFKTILLGKQAHEKNHKDIIEGIDGIRGKCSPKYFKLWHRLPYALYVLFVKIPIKSRIQKFKEKRRLKNKL